MKIIERPGVNINLSEDGNYILIEQPDPMGNERPMEIRIAILDIPQVIQVIQEEAQKAR
jgi:hypothetical protein